MEQGRGGMPCEHLLNNGAALSDDTTHGILTILLRSWFGGFGGGGGPLVPAVAAVACAAAGAAGCCGANATVVAGAGAAEAAVGLPPLLLLAAAVSLPLLDIAKGAGADDGCVCYGANAACVRCS